MNNIKLPPSEPLKFGDMIFISNPNTFGGKLTDIRQGRKSIIVGGKKVKPTHVAIAWGKGNFIFHAVTRGIKFSAVPKYINGKQEDKGEVFVFRNDLLAKAVNNITELEKMRTFIAGYFGEKYNFGVAIKWKSRRDRKFCSELAAELLIEFGYLGKTPKASWYLPIDLMRECARGGDWKKVDIDYAFMYDKNTITKYYDDWIAQYNDPGNKKNFEIHKQIAFKNADLLSQSELSLAHYENVVRRINKEFAKLTEDFKKLNDQVKRKK